ncbi:helix-turn-helix domain-containing protein [Derxia gummosa]|uniref:Helix-turn-helix domain-containing protein n=1 Tax=Derxia gummosa DSM 723 TaxID=1121388 RepID=A0A8B6X2W5_9BURK|nr:AraC family transcriptional regulator [Derxia gummosa]
MFDTRLTQLAPSAANHAHGYHQLVMAVDGRAEFEVNGRGGEVCRVRACLVPGDAEHQFAGVGSNRMLIIDLDGKDARPEDEALLDQLFSAPRYPALDPDFQRLLMQAGAELHRHGDDPWLARGLGHVLLRALHLRMRDGRPAPARQLDLGRIDAYIEQHLDRGIAVAELAGVACLSLSHFHAQFKDSAGMTPHQYVLRHRLDRAARLLRDSDLPLVRIAEDCGFSSQSALTTAMRQQLGLTPRRLRQARGE